MLQKGLLIFKKTSAGRPLSFLPPSGRFSSTDIILQSLILEKATVTNIEYYDCMNIHY